MASLSGSEQKSRPWSLTVELHTNPIRLIRSNPKHPDETSVSVACPSGS
jgi:hypothetical protein